MATLNIEGRNVRVDDSFLKLSPEDQQSTVDEIASSFADPVSTNDVVRAAATGVPIIGGLLNKADAATNAALAPILNPLFDPKDQLQGDTFSQQFANSLAMQQGSDTKFAAQHPVVDAGAKLAGGAASMVPAMAAAPALLGASGGLAARMTMGGLSNAAIGGTDAAIRGEDPLVAAGLGGALGAGAPAAAAALHGVASPFISNITARINPKSYAQRQVARGIVESGRSTADIASDVTNAANEGQGVFNVADAMGNSGQRLLSTVARAPGEGRTAVVDTLEGRQGTQGRRISNALAEGFDSRQTAAQTEAQLTAARGAQADADYSAVRNDAGPVDVSDVIDHIDANVPDEPAAPDTISGRLQRYRNMLSGDDGDLSDFTQVQRVRSELSDEIQAATRSGQGNRARMLGQVLSRLDTSMENASPGFRQANANFAGASRNIDAVQSGRDAFNRGRTEDVISAFQNLTPEGQAAFRSGYVDPAIAQTQGAAFGVNKARPLLNSAFQDEAAAMAPGNPLMQRRIAREQTMFTTRNQALGNSKTAENLADADAMGIDPSVVGHVISGNYAGAVRSLIAAGSNQLTGNTPAVRQAVANILLQHGAAAGPALDNLVGQAVARIQMVQQLARGATRAGSGAIATTVDARNQPAPIFAKRKANQ